MVIGREVYNINEEFDKEEFEIIKTDLLSMMEENWANVKAKRTNMSDGFSLFSVKTDWLCNVYNDRCINGNLTQTLIDVINKKCPKNPWNDHTRVYLYGVAVEEKHRHLIPEQLKLIQSIEK